MIDANATNLTNLADPTADSDAVTLSYLESSLSSDVTGIVADNTVIRVIDNGTNAGLFLGNVDNQQVMRSTANSFSLFGQGYAQTTPSLMLQKLDQMQTLLQYEEQLLLLVMLWVDMLVLPHLIIHQLVT